MSILKQLDTRVWVLISFVMMSCLMVVQAFIDNRNDNKVQAKIITLHNQETSLQLHIKTLRVTFDQQVSSMKDLLFQGKYGDLYFSQLSEYYEYEREMINHLDKLLLLVSIDDQLHAQTKKIIEEYHILNKRYRKAIREFNATDERANVYIDRALGNSDKDFIRLLTILNDKAIYQQQNKVARLHADTSQERLFIWLLIAVISMLLIVFLYIIVDKKIKALRESEQNFNALSSNMLDGVLVNYGGKHVFANESLASMLGYKNAEELIGTTIKDVVHPDELENVLNHHRLRTQGTDIENMYESLFITKTGEPLPVELNASMTTWKGKAAGMVTIKDITKRIEINEAHKKSEARFHILVENIPGMSYRCACDNDWTMTYLNEGVEKLTGYPAEDFLNNQKRSYASIIHPDDVQMVEDAVMKAVNEQQAFTIEYRIIKANGDTCYVFEKGQGVYDDHGNLSFLDGVILDVTDLVEARNALHESELWMESIYNALDEAVLVVSPDRELLNVNDAAIKMFGYSREKIISSSTELFHIDHQHFIEFGDNIKKAFNDNKIAHFEFKAKRQNGEIFPTEHTVTQLKDNNDKVIGIVSVVRDISERKQAEEGIQRLAAIVNSSSDFIGFASLEGYPQFINKAGKKMVGLDNEEEAFNTRVIDYFPDEHRHRVESEIVPQVMETGHWAGEIDFQHFKTGEKIPVLYDMFRIDDPISGKPINFATVTRDIREKKATELELNRHREHLEDLVRERTRELHDAHQDLIRSERLATLGQLTATVSHELRNPLGAMRPSLFVIDKKSDKTDERVQQAIGLIDRNINRCDNIIDELLDFTRITNLDTHPTRIDEWLESVIDEQTTSKNIRIEKNFSLQNVELAIDSNRLRRAIINIVENACHAMLNKEQTDAIKGSCLSIKTSDNDSRIEIIISDNGSGISENIMEKLFEPLFSTKGFGVGLGMPIVKQIMEQHGGGIEIDSKENKGTTVTLWLPGVIISKNIGIA